MTAAIQTSLFHRLCNTPLLDILRGKISARLDWRTRLAVAGLPDAANELIVRVVNRTRLWRIEKVALADELIAHFRDALESEPSIESIIESFGDVGPAAKLIRRAKIRNRPMLWHGLRWARRGFLLLVIVYAVAAAEFLFTYPVPTVDYAAKLTQSWAATPESDRAWPLYRQAILGMFFDSPADRKIPRRRVQLPWLGSYVDGKRWPEMEPWLRQHSADLERVRLGAEKPVFGMSILEAQSAENQPLQDDDARLMKGHDGSLLESYQYWHLGYPRALALLLAADAKLAQLQHDSTRLGRDLVSMVNLANQLRANDGLLVTDLTALSVDAISMDAIQRALQANPAALSDAQLARLTRFIDKPRTGADLVSFSGERMLFDDFVQHIYSDDGKDDGHMTATGMRFLNSWVSRNSGVVGSKEIVEYAAGPAIMTASASRKELLERYDRLMNLNEAVLQVPARDADLLAPQRAIQEMKSSRIRYGVLISLQPALDNLPQILERYLGRRDGVATALAVERYRRANEAYPPKLDALVPRYLANVPPDRITGDPIKYKLVAGKPLLYSVGMDRVDDGGKMAFDNGLREPDPELTAHWGSNPAGKIVRGDWILYPFPPPAYDN